MDNIRHYINLVEGSQSYKTQLLSSVYTYPITESVLMEDFGLSSLWKDLKNVLGNVADVIWGGIKNIVSSISSLLSGVPKYIVQGAVSFVLWCARHPIITILGSLALKNPTIGSEAIKNATALIVQAFGGDAGSRGQMMLGGIESLIGGRFGPIGNLIGFLSGAQINFRDPKSEGAVWSNVLDAMETINEWVGKVISPEAIQMIASFAVNYAIPIVAVAAIIYGGQKLYQYMKKNSPPKTTESKIENIVKKSTNNQPVVDKEKPANESIRELINKLS
jgi:hypothetical protein